MTLRLFFLFLAALSTSSSAQRPDQHDYMGDGDGPASTVPMSLGWWAIVGIWVAICYGSIIISKRFPKLWWLQPLAPFSPLIYAGIMALIERVK